MEKIVIGIDVSKLTLDICIQVNKENRFENISNTEKAIKDFFKQFDKKTRNSDWNGEYRSI
ncbi:hypothetical protein OBK20_03190 [Empedobacter falsenii]|uniref:hypothetical protein n=1 Tax=Empedobacter sp. 225-1 TaxID=2746725 RepID=UPI002578416E|nr:hypothetical protein [Empedobacter sp. 225-1]MDM1522605.1 hypothetical protein [Empedobacter sp. 225-1]